MLTWIRRYSWLIVILLGPLSGCGSNAPDMNGDENKGNLHVQAASTLERSGNGADESADIQFSVPDPSPNEPVKAMMKIDPENVPAGETVTVFVSVRIARAHYLHAVNNSDKTFIPVAVNVPLPKGIEAAGEWQFPTPDKVHGNALGYRDSMLMRRSLKVLSSATQQTLLLTGELSYQACTDELCWPPGKIALSAPLRNSIPNEVIR